MFNKFSIIALTLFFFNSNAQSIVGLQTAFYQIDSKMQNGSSLSRQKKDSAPKSGLSFKDLNVFFKNLHFKKEVSVFAVFENAEKNRHVSIASSFKQKLLLNDSISGKPVEKKVKDVGSIQSYHSIKSLIKDLSILNLDDEIDSDTEVDIQELVIVPRVVSSKERQIIETQLSLRHGISLCESCNYLDPAGKVIWNHEQSNGYNQNVFGLAIDDEFKFFKTFAKHKSDKLLSFEVSNNQATNNNERKTYAILGSNNKEFKINTSLSEDGFLSFEKSWLIGYRSRQQSNEKLNFTLALDSLAKESLKLSNEKVLRISVAPYLPNSLDYENINTADWHDVELENDTAKFSFPINKITNNDSTYYKRIKLVITPKMFAKVNRNYDCDKLENNYRFDIVGGTYPFTIDFIDVVGNKNRFIYNNSSFALKSRISGQLALISDLNGLSYTVNLEEIETGHGHHLRLDLQYAELEKICRVTALTENKAEEIEWISNKGELVGVGDQVQLKEKGDYLVKITTNGQCRIFENFRVDFEDKTQNKELEVFPNPVIAGMSYRICNLTSIGEKIKIDTFDVNGKQIFQELVRSNNECLHINAPNYPGTYFIRLSSSKSTSTTKIIVK